ncbi:MAG: sugar ABC transporter permease [Microbacteriaceae bacterium]|nr:sugar ABC transporter permease [Microbacteriaceae bacterium]
MEGTRMNTAKRKSSRSTGAGLGFGAGMLFVLPAAALFAVFILVPLVTAAGYSFFNWAGLHNEGFAGLDNYVTLFTKPPYRDQVWPALGHNLLLFIGAMLFQNTLGLAIATFLHRFDRLRRFFQTIYTMPYLVSPLVIGYLWSLMLSPLFGPVNNLLKQIGLGEFAHPWLGDPNTAIWMVALITAWQWLGFPILLYGAAIAGIPQELGEAASIDGATPAKRFWHITFPLLAPAIGTVSILTFIGAMESFPIPFAIGGSKGDPAYSTDVLSLLFYRTGFAADNGGHIGVASAIATLLFLFIFGVAVVARRMLDRVERRLT